MTIARPLPDPGAQDASRRRDTLWALLLGAAVFLAYLPALSGGMILDDDLHITAPALQTWSGLWRIWFDVGATQQYYPVLHSAFWLEHRLWGDAVLGYHLLNLGLHACTALALVALMRRLSLPGAWLGAFLFALHPVCVESVAWIAEQKNTLSALCAVGAAVCYLDYDLRRRGSDYCFAFVLFMLALLSKTVVVTLPAVLLILVCWRRRQIAWSRDVAPLLPWFAAGLAASLVTLRVEHQLLSRVNAGFSLSPVERLLLAARMPFFYLAKALWPADLTFFYPKWTIDSSDWTAYIWVAGAALIAGTALLKARRLPGTAAAVLCYLATLAPVLGFFNVEWFVFSYIADHLQYLSLLCFAATVAAGAASAQRRLGRQGRRAALCGAGIVLGLLAVLTWRQCARYRDPVTFYETAMAHNPTSVAAHDHLGTAHYNIGYALQTKAGNLPGAIHEYEEALRIKPDYAEAHDNLGMALADSGRNDEAVAHFREAVRLKPAFAGAHYNLGNALKKTGDNRGSLQELETAVRLMPENAAAHYALGEALEVIPGRTGEARTQYDKALRLKPDYAEAHYGLGSVYQGQGGHMNEAIAQFEEALRINPGLFQAQFSLAYALGTIPGRTGDAVSHYEAALRLRPDDASAHFNLACLLQTMPGRVPDAVAQYEDSLKVQPANAMALANLGNALNTLGQPSKAIEAYQSALALDPKNPILHFNFGIVLLKFPERTTEAVAQFKEADRLQPGNETIRRILRRLGAP